MRTNTHVVLLKIMDLWCTGSSGSVVSYCTASGEGASLTLHRLSERDGAWQFEPTPGPPLGAAGCRKTVLACQTALDVSQGVKVPFLVAKEPNNDSELEILAFSDSNPCNSLLSCGTVHVLDTVTAIRSGLVILDGPVVIWGEEGAVCIATKGLDSQQSFTQHKISTNEFTGSTEHSYTVERLWCFSCPDDTVLLFVRLAPPSPEQPSASWLCLSVTEKSSVGELDVHKLPSHCYIHSDYGWIATCVAVHYEWCVGREGGLHSAMSVLVGTRYRQVVWLRGGIPLHCVTVETVPKDLAILEVPGNDIMAFAVRTAGERLTAYQVPPEGEPRETGRWEGVAHVLVGNFADLTRDQLLLLFSTKSDRIVEFLVTDLASFNLSGPTGRVESRPSAPVSESLMAALKALQVRQRVGEAYLTEVQRELQQKTELLRDSLQLLQSLGNRPADHTLPSQPHPPPPRDQSLVCVIPGKMDGAENFVGVSDSAHHNPIVTECWQRLLNGHWAVGVVIKNPTSSVWWQPSLALVVDDVPLVERGDCRAVCVSPGQAEGGGSCKQPAAKRPKMEGEGEKVRERLLGAGLEEEIDWQQCCSVAPGGVVCLVAWVTLPTEHQQMSGVLCGGLVLNWRERGGGFGGVGRGKCGGVRVVEVGRVELPMSRLTDPSLQCELQCLQLWHGEVTLCGEWRDFREKQYQDLACLLATQHITQVEVSSQYTDMTSLGDLLRRRLPLPPHCVLPRPHSTLPHTRDGTGTGNMVPGTETEQKRDCPELEGVFIFVTGHRHTASLSALHRTSASLTVLLSALHSCLPDDLTLSHRHTSHPHTLCHPHSSPINAQQIQTIRLCVRALRKEVEKRKESVKRGMVGGEWREEVKGEGERGGRGKVERREEVKGGMEEGERESAGMAEMVEETNFAMFRAMSLLHM